MLYAVAAAKGIEGTIWAGGRALASKLVKPEQQGLLLIKSSRALLQHSLLYA